MEISLAYEITSNSADGMGHSESRDTALEAIALAREWIDKNRGNVQVKHVPTEEVFQENRLSDLLDAGEHRVPPSGQV